jgi:membrane protein required for colicin V production
MQIYDLIMLAVLALTTFRGYRKGLAWQVAALGSIVVSYFVAYRFRDQVAVYLEFPDPWRRLAAMLILYVASSLVIWLLFQTVKGAIEKAKLKDFDQQLGAIFGLVKGAALCVVITLFAVSLLQPNMTQRIVDSRSGGYIARVLDRSESLIPPELRQVLEPYLQKAGERLQDRPSRSESSVDLPPADGRFNSVLLDDRDGTNSMSNRNETPWR